MVVHFPKISLTGHREYGLVDFRNLVGSIACTVELDLLNEYVDLRRLKPGNRRVEVEVEVRQVLQLLSQEFAIPAGVFGHPVVSDHVGALLRFGHMVQAYGRHLRDAEQLGGLDSAVTGDYSEVRTD